MKDSPESRDISVIAMSSDNTSEPGAADPRAQALQLGAVDFLGKPFTRGDLVRSVSKYILT